MIIINHDLAGNRVLCSNIAGRGIRGRGMVAITSDGRFAIMEWLIGLLYAVSHVAFALINIL